MSIVVFKPQSMKILPANFLITYCAIFITSLLSGCKEEEAKARVSINSFSMEVNGQLWMPFQSKDDPCASTYGGHSSDLGEIPIYTIYAYRDPAGIDDATSDNLLRIRIMNVTKPGAYPLDGTYKEDFESYFIFAVQQPAGNAKRYVNDPGRSPFVINVQELIPIKYSPTKGIKGSFSGILYNEADPSDSLTIENGKFTFNIVNVNYDRHCGF